MSAPVKEYRWAPPPTPRAKPIPAEQWEEHEAVLRQLHQTMTLDALMDYMGQHHNFHPTRRQYVHQFMKWKMGKYNTVTRSAAAVAAADPSLAGTPSLGLGGAGLSAAESAKRHLSMVSLQSSLSPGAGTGTSPPKKKNKQEEEDIDDGTALPTQAASLQDTMSLDIPGPSAAAPLAASTHTTPASRSLKTHAPHGVEREPAPSGNGLLGAVGSGQMGATASIATVPPPNATVPVATSSADPTGDNRTEELKSTDLADNFSQADRMSIANPFDEEPLPGDPFSNEQDYLFDDDTDEDGYSFVSSVATSDRAATPTENHFPPAWGSVEELSQLIRTIDINQPADTFSPRDLANAKRAAEYLHACYYPEESFKLFVLLLKQHQGDRSIDDVRYWGRVFCAVHSCSTKTHFEIMEKILGDELAKYDTSSPQNDTIVFTLRMAWAFMCARVPQPGMWDHYSAARAKGNIGGMAAHLPERNRSFDFWLHIGQLRARNENADIIIRPTAPWAWPYTADDCELENAMLRRVPGPFELCESTGVLGNPCLMSCLRWCDREIRAITALPGPWLSAKKPRARYMAETAALFTALWDRWHGVTPQGDDAELTVWMHESEQRMGITATELLRAVSAFIAGAMKWDKRASSTSQLLSRLRASSSFTIGLPPTHFARYTLRTFVNRRLIAYWPKEMDVFQKTAKAYIMAGLERTLLVTFEGLKQSASTPGSPLHTLRFAAAAVLPTLASSLSSLNLNVLQKTRDRVEHSIRSFKMFAVELPSAGFREGSGRLSFLTMSELSHAMERSMSISCRTRGSSSRRKLLRHTTGESQNEKTENRHSRHGPATAAEGSAAIETVNEKTESWPK